MTAHDLLHHSKAQKKKKKTEVAGSKLHPHISVEIQIESSCHPNAQPQIIIHKLNPEKAEVLVVC